MMALTSREFELLNGLRLGGHAYISANEHIVANELCRRGLAHSWETGTGFQAWRISEKGIAEVFAEEKRQGLAEGATQ